MNKTLLEAAMKRLEREAEGVNFGEISLRAEIRDGRINRFVFARESGVLARELTGEGCHENYHRQ
jgi:hypothetical protein